MARTGGHLPLDPYRPSERLPWALKWKIPRFFRRALPQPVINGLHELKVRILTRDLSRDREFELEDTQSSASMSIVVPVHDAPLVTRRCLASLEKYAPKAEIIIVDDGSRLVETSKVIGDFSSRNEWKVVNHATPLGHSASCGAGASLATRPYLCLLNSDTVVTPWCWRLVKDVFEHDQKTAVAGPSTSNSGNVQALPLATVLSPYLNDNQICGFAKRLLAECPDPIVADLPWASGFAFFIRRNLWEQLSGFDRKIPDYYNDVELCKRVVEKGYRTVWIRNAYIHHLGRQSYRETIGEDGVVARIEAALIYSKQKHSMHL
jgi:GT2 family glycosyltransferase